jgi:MFS family permease
MTPAGPARTTFRDVFGLAEFRALWTAQLLSVAGDQLARVGLTVLVYDRTRSALLAAVTFAASVVPMFVGGLTLAGLADRLPRRGVMIGADLASGVLVAVMAVPGMPLAVLIALLAAITMIGALFLAARSAIYPDILHGDRYVLGTAVTITTVQFAQVVGFAAGGVAVGFLGLRGALLADAATFAASATITRLWVRARPGPARPAPAGPGPASRGPSGPAEPEPSGPGAARPRKTAGPAAGLRLVFGRPALRTAMFLGWLCAFYEVPEGVATPLARAAGGGAVTVGLILAAQALGSTAGALGFSRFVSPARRLRWAGSLAVAACAALALFAAGPGLPAALVILALSGLFGCYQLAANASFVQATPPAQRSQAFGIAQGGMSLGQGAAIILAGAAAERFAPSSVIAVAGGAGALCALAVALSKPARPGWRPAGRPEPAAALTPAGRGAAPERQ